MTKTFSILFPLILIVKIVFSSLLKTIEIEVLNSTSIQNIKLNAHFGNTSVIEIQSKFKLDNLLIFLSSDKFKYCILPYLSSHNFLKIYHHFQNLVPELNFEKFLPPSRFYTTNNILDIQEPTTYLQPLEINLLYQFNGEYSSLKPHILYSSKNKIPIIVEPHIPPDSICAHLSQNKIIPYETYVIPTSHQKLLILKNNGGDHFFVTFEKSKGQFINFAKCSRVSEKEFSDYVECIWEAYNLQGWKKYYWKTKLFLNIPYEKYLFHVVKIISYLVESMVGAFRIVDECLGKAVESDHLCVKILGGLCFLPLTVIIAGASLTVLSVWYHATLLPFYILTIPLKQFDFVLNWYSFYFVSQTLASFYVCCFPQIKKCVPFSVKETKKNEPKKIMSLVPLLVQKRNNCEERLNSLKICYYIFLIGFPFTLFFAITDGDFSEFFFGLAALLLAGLLCLD